MIKDKKLCLPNIVADMPWGDLTIKEMDLLLVLLIIIAIDKKITTTRSFTEFKRLAGIPNNKELINKVDKISSMTTRDKILKDIVIDHERQLVTVTASNDFINLINNRKLGHYMLINVDAFKSLHQKAAKVIYLNMCRYSCNKCWMVKIDDFRTLMGIKQDTPAKYIKRDVIVPATKEIQAKIMPDAEITCKPLKNNMATSKITTYHISYGRNKPKNKK